MERRARDVKNIAHLGLSLSILKQNQVLGPSVPVSGDDESALVGAFLCMKELCISCIGNCRPAERVINRCLDQSSTTCTQCRQLVVVHFLTFEPLARSLVIRKKYENRPGAGLRTHEPFPATKREARTALSSSLWRTCLCYRSC